MKFFWLGHSAFRIEFGDTVLIIDPFLNGNKCFADSQYAGDLAKATEGCTHVAITHGHNDHVGDALKIIENTGATLIANPEICQYLSGKATKDIKTCAGNSGGTVDLGEFTLTFVQAVHSSSYTEADGTIVYLGNPNGFIINAKGATIYHMGDTDIFGDMELINRLYHPNIGIVPIGDVYTMGAQNAAFAVKKYFNFEMVIPCHYKTFPVLEQSADKFVNAMKESSTKVVVCEVGEKLKIG
ncbi:MAG: metal-dependent hydrolase [Rhizobiales bacterium]|nr:metal-dependent hydrolase [Hyphomicrobiales bacterium]NRB14866.1 metal-dependent hydrolase [Hyphomicrobiales bacterium]